MTNTMTNTVTHAATTILCERVKRLGAALWCPALAEDSSANAPNNTMKT